MPFYDPHPPATLARNFKGYVVVNLLHIALTANSVLDLDERYRNILLIQWSRKKMNSQHYWHSPTWENANNREMPNIRDRFL